ncbi:50S ribosomal protein L14 [Candidatus Micrarchaeota archaeon]|nr:50S ribosomal protein L14 [Candidatus Micrarchaeota archaeon]MBU2476118.1 50S ribosomal protein L14 [Candidatus Micrarchaeota archaeon]
MKAINAKATKGLTQKTQCICADNSGAKILEIITVFKFKSRKKMSQKAGIADLVNAVVKKGKPEIRKKVERAVIIRVKKEYRRKDGTRVKFEDNAAVLVDDKGLPKASEIKGVVAKEVGERWPKVAGIAQGIV